MTDYEFLDYLLPRKSFQLPLSKDVFWVPYTCLSDKSTYTYEEMQKIVTLTPEEKRKCINSIEDAIKLFVLSDFSETDDTTKIMSNGLLWEHYTEGRLAVSTNNGCCATCCAWANYLLQDNFQEVGILGIIRPVGGHAINYLYDGEWYYIIDFQTLIKKYRDKICPQTGKRSDFTKSGFISGILVKTNSLESYVRYYSRYTRQLIPEHLFLKETTVNACPIGERRTEGITRTIYISNDPKVDVIKQEKAPANIKCIKI